MHIVPTKINDVSLFLGLQMQVVPTGLNGVFLFFGPTDVVCSHRIKGCGSIFWVYECGLFPQE